MLINSPLSSSSCYMHLVRLIKESSSQHASPRQHASQAEYISQDNLWGTGFSIFLSRKELECVCVCVGVVCFISFEKRQWILLFSHACFFFFVFFFVVFCFFVTYCKSSAWHKYNREVEQLAVIAGIIVIISKEQHVCPFVPPNGSTGWRVTPLR